MRLVKATAVTGAAAYINLDLVTCMAREDDKTIVFYGSIVAFGASITYSNSQVIETPEELVSLPEVRGSNLKQIKNSDVKRRAP